MALIIPPALVTEIPTPWGDTGSHTMIINNPIISGGMGSVSAARSRIAGDQPRPSGTFGIDRFFTIGKTLTASLVPAWLTTGLGDL